MFSFFVRRAVPLLVLGSLTLSSCVVRQYGPPPPPRHHRGGYYRPGPPPGYRGGY